MRTDFQHLIVKQDGGVLMITMNRPEVLNAFNDIMLAELTEAVEAAAQDEGCELHNPSVRRPSAIPLCLQQPSREGFVWVRRNVPNWVGLWDIS